MPEAFHEVEQRMRDEFQRTRSLNALHWLDRYPEHEDAIEDLLDEFADTVIAEPTTRQREALQRGAERALDEYRAVATADGAERRVGERVLRRRQPRAAPRKTAEWRAKRSVVFAWVAAQLYPADPILDRVKVQKALYLLEAALKLGLFVSFRMHRKGPFDPQLKHLDAEPNGKREGWIVVDDRFITPGPNSAAAVAMARPILQDAGLAEDLMGVLSPYTGWELAVWATVLSLSRRLMKRDEPVSVGSILEEVGRIEQWKDKAQWREFTDERVGEALQHLERLGMVPSEKIAWD
ncbi:MAG: hypothetical protein AVDCRST_MAG68-3368 [uncultured Gemmatimonadetes bacterium]|uniref:Uncharacterized protein n=1 Tax=uncultured Gemmatimonadota bacterium TaxID=203437 RepID=A0A6J4LN01_9BACT|nr:MAG: hypothetical protein AVDCRST_MAG68-3368 [uncultured Gemmatimonadota bacterium]